MRESTRLFGVLCTALLLAGCMPAPESLYIPMSDGTEIAADVWLPRDRPAEGVPTVLRMSRYWRDYQLPAQLPIGLGTYPDNVDWLNASGYAVLIVDVRGTGASFGVSETPWSPPEVADFPQLVDWVLTQPWTNNRVGAIGVSYEGVCADWLGTACHPAVTAVMPAYTYSDVYLDVSHPGGIFNERFVKAWGDVTALMDRDDTSFLDILAMANPYVFPEVLVDAISAALLGVRPVSGAAALLSDALAQHNNNPNVFDAARPIEFRDDLFGSVAVDTVSPLLGAPTHDRSAAIQRIVGWQDAGTARGALSDFNTLRADYHVVVVAPQTHTGNYFCDPYDFGVPQRLRDRNVIREVWQGMAFLDAFLKPDGGGGSRREVVYYTYVENTWKYTPIWPPEGFEMQRWYLAADGVLSTQAPSDTGGADEYIVDYYATTGLYNRWFSGMAGVPIQYVDRAEQDKRLLVYETPPLTQSAELTGHPVVSLQVSSTETDGSVIVYLEDVAPDGTVVYLTEGELRAIHRKVSTDVPPVAIFGPYHTFRRADAQPLVPGETTEITFDLLPISTIIAAGHHIRIAIAGHDADTFARYPAEGTPMLTVQHNAQSASWIDLPLKARADLDAPFEDLFGLW